jgi:hypothetical protein
VDYLLLGPPRLGGTVSTADFWFAHVRRRPDGRMACCRHRTLPDGTTLLADIDPPDTDPALFGYPRWRVVPLPSEADRSSAGDESIRVQRPDWYLAPKWMLP